MDVLKRAWKIFFVYNPIVCFILTLVQLNENSFFLSLLYSNLMAFLTSVPAVYFSEILKNKVKNKFILKNFYLFDFLIALPFLYLAFKIVNSFFLFFQIHPLELDLPLYLNGVIVLFVALLFSSLVHAYIDIKNQSLLKDLENIKLKNENLKKDLKIMTNYINPHFLFNSLNSLAGLISEDPKKAEKVAIVLSELYRGILFALKSEFHSVENELKICSDYLEIEKYRFEDRLTLVENLNLTKEEMSKILIPSLILQPLFENVIKHGVMNNSETTICIFELARDEDMLLICINNNISPGVKNQGTESSLQNLRDRLNLFYQGKAMLRLNKESDFFTVSLKIPICNSLGISSSYV